MFLFSLSIFITAFVLLIALFVLKHFELARTRRLFLRPRTRADRFVIKIASILEDTLPKHGRRISKEASHKAVYHTSSMLLAGVQLIERRLRTLTDMIKGRGVVKEGGRSVSFYLKDIAEHKRQNGFKRDT